jgi:hypothetical protein
MMQHITLCYMMQHITLCYMMYHITLCYMLQHAVILRLDNIFLAKTLFIFPADAHYYKSVEIWCVRLTTLPPSCAVVTKSGNINFLEPSGPLQACNGTALHLLLDTRYIR